MIPSSIMLPQILTTKDHIFSYLRMNKYIALDRPIQKELDLIIQHLQVLNDEVKCLHNIALDHFKRYFIKSSHIYYTRHNGGLDILIPKVCTESANKGTFYTGAQAFNNLPPHLKEVDSTVVLKTQLNDIIFSDNW